MKLAQLTLLAYTRARGWLPVLSESFLLDPLKCLIYLSLLRKSSVSSGLEEFADWSPLFAALVAVTRGLSSYELEVDLQVTHHFRLARLSEVLFARFGLVLLHSLGTLFLGISLIVLNGGGAIHVASLLSCFGAWAVLGLFLSIKIGHRHEKSVNNFVFCLTWLLVASLVQRSDQSLHQMLQWLWPARLDLKLGVSGPSLFVHPGLCAVVGVFLGFFSVQRAKGFLTSRRTGRR